MKIYNLILFCLFYTLGLLATAAGSSRTDGGYLSDYAPSTKGGLSQAVTSTSPITDRWAIRLSVKPSVFLIFLNLVFVSFKLSLSNDTVAARGHILAPQEVPARMLSQKQRQAVNWGEMEVAQGIPARPHIKTGLHPTQTCRIAITARRRRREPGSGAKNTHHSLCLLAAFLNASRPLNKVCFDTRKRCKQTHT